VSLVVLAFLDAAVHALFGVGVEWVEWLQAYELCAMCRWVVIVPLPFSASTSQVTVDIFAVNLSFF
jgi:hypothetical protein